MPEEEEQQGFDEVIDLLGKPDWSFNVRVSSGLKVSLAPEGQEPVDVDFESVRLIDYERHEVHFLAKALSPEVESDIHELLGMAAHEHIPTATDRIAEIITRTNPKNYTDALESIIKLLISHGGEAREFLVEFLARVMQP